MKLGKDQVAEFHDKGYVLVPDVLSAAERGVLEDAMANVLARPGPEVAREADGAPHVCWGMHLFDERFGALTRHPKLLGPAEQLLGNQVFVHQSRVNVKQQNGSIVDWHQDFGTYHRVDGIPEPRGLMIAVFMDDVTACNAPLILIPRSQHHGVVREADIDTGKNDYEGAAKFLYAITPETIAALIDENGVEAITGRAGAVLFMHINVVHASSVNITPLRRVLLYLNVSTTDNRGETFERPPHLAARDFSPLEPLGEDCLLNYAR